MRMPVLAAGLVRLSSTQPWSPAPGFGATTSSYGAYAPCGANESHCTCAATSMCLNPLTRYCPDTDTCSYDNYCNCNCKAPSPR